VGEPLDRQIGKSGRTAAGWSRNESSNRHQLSTTERIATTFELACGLPMWIQFFEGVSDGDLPNS
jgi:hypothetical protein